jgi:hypothetical protein
MFAVETTDGLLISTGFDNLGEAQAFARGWELAAAHFDLSGSNRSAVVVSAEKISIQGRIKRTAQE